MSTQIPVLFLRLEGPLQAWGDSSRFRVRETAAAPTLSGVVGLIACCMGRRRDKPLGPLTNLDLAVRVDRPGVPLRDYHTVGAGFGLMSADGKRKKTASTGQWETFLTDRYYLCDASFLAAVTGPDDLLDAAEDAIRHPVWTPFLGRKSCPPSTPIFAGRGRYPSLVDALSSQPWRPRLEEADPLPPRLTCFIPCSADDPGALLQHDRPISFAEPRRMAPRHVRKTLLTPTVGEPRMRPYKPPRPERLRYNTSAWKKRRLDRAEIDRFLCVFCKSPSYIAHHVTYERANREDVEQDLRSVCRLCHDAITMIEAEREMGLIRIDPLSPKYRELIIDRRRRIEKERRTARTRRRR